jgi:hypothetical protein
MAKENREGKLGKEKDKEKEKEKRNEKRETRRGKRDMKFWIFDFCKSSINPSMTDMIRFDLM